MVVYLPDYIVLKGQIIEDDSELNDIFQSVKSLTKSEFAVEKIRIVEKSWFHKSETWRYTLYEPAGPSRVEWAIAQCGTRESLLAYFRGIIDGLTLYK